jgi:hypothetical protein
MYYADGALARRLIHVSQGDAHGPELRDIGQQILLRNVPSDVDRTEEKGLIASAERRGMRRLFDSRVLERLAVIALARAAGFSLEEIAQSLLPDGGFRIDRARLTAKARELDRTIQRLTAIRDDLRHAAACPAPTHMECPNFQGSW